VISVEINRDDIQGSINNHAEATLFDGIGLKVIPVLKNKFFGPHGITLNYSGVLYFTKQGHYPETIIFKAQDKLLTIDNVSLLPLKDTGKGVLTGVVYKPVTGGKIKEHKGIARMFKGEKVSIVKDNLPQEVITDDNGVFMIELLPGEYDIVFNKKNVHRVLIEKGRTTLENIQKGILLVD
jgi:hypothetical protein